MHSPVEEAEGKAQRQSSPGRPPRTSCGRRLGRQDQHYALPETDPIATGRLWSTVSEKMRQGGKTPSRGRGRATQSPSGSKLPLRSTYTESEADSVPDSSTSSRARALRPQQYSVFKQRILAPRDITIDAKTRITRGPYSHFGTEKPTSDRPLRQLNASSVLLDLGKDQAKRIAAHYDFMRAKRLCEAEFATYATETFFLGEPRNAAPPEDRTWRAERMLQLVCPPTDDAHWLRPPLLHKDVARSDDYTWDVRPDCAYWISTRGFNEEYVHNIKGACFVYQDWVLCPYLTIEFKRDSEDIAAAQSQAVTAGAVALYNRFELRCRADFEAVDEATALPDLAHYAITFTGPRYTVWRLTPNPLEEASAWNGCCMVFLDHGDCTHTFDVTRLVEWINEIHGWGLSTHAQACEMDVKRVLNHEGTLPDARGSSLASPSTSIVSMLLRE
ncbi:hypothetical protein LTR53_006955 [Teratosphaeriaceae sp. CCFEE 6253]|nr:hypothetical protein LTR53_006955 [Teratosphaeriaceae sp. CCFEE 6253]